MASNNVIDTEMAANGIAANQTASREMVANEMAVSQMKINQMKINKMTVNEMATDNAATNNMAANNMATNNMAANNMAANNMAANNMAANNMATSNMATGNAAATTTEIIPLIFRVPQEILTKILSHVGFRERTVGVAPELDNRALRHSLPATVFVNRQMLQVFKCAVYANVSDPQHVPGVSTPTVFVHPACDTMTLGYNTDEAMEPVDLIKAPNHYLLVHGLKKIWLADRNILWSAGYSGIDLEVADRESSEIAVFPLDKLVYKKLETITLSSEKYDCDLRDDESFAFGFDIIYHVQTGHVFMGRVFNFQDGDWINLRDGNKVFNPRDSFLTRIKIDRCPGLSHINPDPIDYVIKEKGREPLDKSEPLASVEEACEMWRYNWQVCIDYIKLRLT